MPQHENAKMHNIHFVTCSNQTDALSMMQPTIADLKRLEEGIPAYDAYLKKEVLLVAPVMAFLCDNPRHSELINRAGGCQRSIAECAWYVYYYYYIYNTHQYIGVVELVS